MLTVKGYFYICIAVFSCHFTCFNRSFKEDKVQVLISPETGRTIRMGLAILTMITG